MKIEQTVIVLSFKFWRYGGHANANSSIFTSANLLAYDGVLAPRPIKPKPFRKFLLLKLMIFWLDRYKINKKTATKISCCSILTPFLKPSGVFVKNDLNYSSSLRATWSKSCPVTSALIFVSNSSIRSGLSNKRVFTASRP